MALLFSCATPARRKCTHSISRLPDLLLTSPSLSGNADPDIPILKEAKAESASDRRRGLSQNYDKDQKQNQED
jgi:hypothetical protein